MKKCYIKLTHQEWGESLGIYQVGLVITADLLDTCISISVYRYIGTIKGSVGEMWKLSSPAQTFMLQEAVFISANGR